MEINDIIGGSIGLSVTPPSQSRFTEGLLLVDHADIPLDKRFAIVTRSNYQTRLTADSVADKWCDALWSQSNSPAQAYIGRWVSAATASYMVFAQATAVASVYAALTSTAKIELTEAGETPVDINPDFTGDTTMADVAASVTTAMAGIFAAYTCTIDALDRLIITSDNTGASAAAVSADSPATGTDLTSALYFGASTSVAGSDIEAQGTAASAIFALDNTPFIVCEDGGSTAQQIALSTAINALDKILLLNDDEPLAKDSGDTTDAGYSIEALGHQKTHIVYSEHTTNIGAAANQYPDAATIGETLQELEGSSSLAFVPLTGLSQSGLDPDGTTVIALTPTEISALEAKGYDFLIKPSTSTHLRHGLAAGGNEMRVMIFKSFMFAKVAEEAYGYMVANDVVTFSDKDITAIKGIIERWANVGVDRGILDGDSFVWNMPTAASFSAATRATHTLALPNVWSADVLNSVNDVTISMDFNV